MDLEHPLSQPPNFGTNYLTTYDISVALTVHSFSLAIRTEDNFFEQIAEAIQTDDIFSNR